MLPLYTERLALRDFVAGDAEAYAALRRGADFGRLYPAEETSEAFSHRLLALFVEQQAAVPRSHWQLAVTRRDDGTLLGSCGIRTVEPGRMSFGCELGEAWWGRGYAAEAAQALFDFAGRIGCRELVADTLAANHAAVALARRLGFTIADEAGEAREFAGQRHAALRLRMPLPATHPTR